MTKCSDCGAAPAETRCECDFAGIRVQRRITALEAALAEERQLSAAFETLANAYRIGKKLPPERALSTIERIKERRAAIDAAREGG